MLQCMCVNGSWPRGFDPHTQQPMSGDDTYSLLVCLKSLTTTNASQQQPNANRHKNNQRRQVSLCKLKSNSTFDETLVGRTQLGREHSKSTTESHRDREIKSSFGKLCLKFHPDKYSPNLGIPEMFKIYNIAYLYEFLKDDDFLGPTTQPR